MHKCLPVKVTCANRGNNAVFVASQVVLYRYVHSVHFLLMGVNWPNFKVLNSHMAILICQLNKADNEENSNLS